MSREAHVRFCESAGVRLPRATHLGKALVLPQIVNNVPWAENAEFPANWAYGKRCGERSGFWRPYRG